MGNINKDSLFETVIAIEKISNVKNTKGVNIFAITGDILRIQIYFNRDEICKSEDKTKYNIVYKKLFNF